MSTSKTDDQIGQPSTSSRPSAHTQRYDRQLRLWASSGQASLESANVAILGAGYLSACVIKNLVLPGMGKFVLVDSRSIDEADLGNNFFISSSAKGKGRAEEVLQNLLELNPEVKGEAIKQEPAKWAQDVDLDAFTMVIAVNQPSSVLLPLAAKAWQAKGGVGIPLMTVAGAGLIGEISVQIKEAGIIETHPDNTIDLRLTRPWAELEAYADSYDMDASDTMARSHIPFVIVLLRKLEEWSQTHDGKLPQPSKDRKAFTDSINELRKGSDADEENIDEALAALGQHIWRPIANGLETKIPSEIDSLLKDEACTNISSKSTNFWLLVRALREFVEKGDGTLPLPGSLPDMKAQSSTYVELQKLYKTKASEDVQQLQQHLEEILNQVGLPSNAISQDEIESFAKHTSYLKLIRGRPLNDRLEKPDANAISMAFMDPVNPVTIPYHVALVASEDFAGKNGGRYPGSNLALSLNITGSDGEGSRSESELESEPELEQDVSALVSLANARLSLWGVELDEDQMELVQDACAEVARSGHADLPNTAALLGGVAAQEAIKLVTRQYVPLDNVAIYDGVKQAIGVFKL
ncbi:uncharacterized protein FA14DRAFT_159419 [Meira miltonrushii]|uniref:NEDD8-activating enzyme E1 regulatory subunit n=1 Tax=Meira miltonrushii TaxID=1280837 RepID=A0A316VJR8_9BASI|nr:uncharacterized protein FA14DRAFT_159419 [Meira miltonrushii]PWN37308.1 hypothetical protein FA14DRAFT_159419 [Meira miltonrushii]